MRKNLILTNKVFRNIWLAQLISLFGDVFYDVALVWYLMSRTGSALIAGGIAVFDLVGKFFGALIINQLIDKKPSKTIMLISDGFNILVLCFAIFLIFLGNVPIFVFYILAFVIAFFGAMFAPARNKCIMEIVDKKRYVEANAFENISRSVVQISSWILGGIIMQYLGLTIALLANVITFLLSALLVGVTHWTGHIVEKKAKRKVEFLTSLQLIKANKILQIVVLLETIYMTLMGFYWASLPLKVYEIGNAFSYGLQGAAFGVGYLFTSILVSKYFNTNKTGKFYLIGISIHCLGNFLAAFSPMIYLFMFGVFLAGLGNTFWQISKVTSIQKSTSIKNAGKVFSFIDIVMNFSMIIAWIFGGILSDVFSPTFVMVTVCVLQAATILFIYKGKTLFNFKEDTILNVE